MEYPFKDLLPLDEVEARDGYYKDWTHIDADTFHQISELAKFIREKGYGADTREAIAQALERVYHDAAKSGNANMEVSMARKHFKDLASRLDASDDKLASTTAQLAQKANESDLVAERNRIDSFVTLSEGSTTGDAELIDTRIGKNGELYNNAGNAVRGQVDAVASELENVIEVRRSKQLFNYDTLVKGYFFDQENELYSTSDFIKVTPGNRIYIYRWDKHDEIKTNVWGIETYNADKNKQERIQLATFKNYYDNENASYIKLSGQTSYITLTAVEENSQTITTKTDYVSPIRRIKESVQIPQSTYNFLSGKSLITLGDSITAGAGVTDKSKAWGSLIATRNDMVYKNAGISGSTMGEAVDGTDKNASYKNGRHLEIEGYDYATIWFGWNDFNFCELGTVGTADVTTTLGAYYKTLQEIVMNFPETKVGVVIPYLWAWNEDPQGYTIMSLLNGIKETCERFGVPYLDINKYNFLQSWGSDYPNDSLHYVKWDARQKVFTSDTLHPNEKGNKYLSTIIENFIRSL